MTGAGEHVDEPGWLIPAAGVAGTLLSMVGLSGVGDAPAPNEPASSMATHFANVRGDVLRAAPLGQLGAVLLAVFFVLLARRSRRRSPTAVPTAIAVGGLAAASYLLVLHVVYASIAYPRSLAPDVVKGWFVATIVTTPVFGAATSAALLAAARGGFAGRWTPHWWNVLSLVLAVVTLVALFSYRDSGFFSPDVQQQVVGNIVFGWVLITSATIAVLDRRAVS